MAFGNFFLRDSMRSPEWATYSFILPARAANDSAGYDSSYPLTELAI